MQSVITQKHKAFGREFLNTDPKKVIRVPWNGQDGVWWNEICADIMEVFGLPGNRYTSHPTPNYMDFHFKSQKDVELCRILISEKI
jgi:hypothetical protein